MASDGHGTKAIVAAFFANLGIAIAKFVGFVFTGSGSMLAESVHSVADTGNQALLLLGGRRAARPATPDHPFGFGRERYFWAFVVSVVLFTLGSAFAIFEGIEKLRHPHEVESPEWAIGILAVAILLESWSFRTAIVESRPHKGDASWWRFIRRSKIPELPVVLLEDLGALLGLTFALAAVVLTTDHRQRDLGCSGHARHRHPARHHRHRAGDRDAQPVPGRVGLAERRAQDQQTPSKSSRRSSGSSTCGPSTSDPRSSWWPARSSSRGDLTMTELAHGIDAVEAAVRAAVPAARMIYLEPDITRAHPEGSPKTRRPREIPGTSAVVGQWFREGVTASRRP